MCKDCGCAELGANSHQRHTISVRQGILVLSSPGSGKTAFIERMLRDCGVRIRIGVIVGDLETDNDANRLRLHGTPAVQITNCPSSGI